MRPTFRVAAENAAAVAEVCRRVDGLPLAIELAAARLRVLSVGEIAARLDDRFGLLTGGSRAALPRQRTLRALLDWSHDLLSEQERRVLRRLAVFAGGWTLDAAESVCAFEAGEGGKGEGERGGDKPLSPFPLPLSPYEVLEPLARLVDRSLITVEHRGSEVRYRFLESIRRYAEEKLGEAGEEEDARDRLCDWILRLAERAEPHLETSEQAAYLDRLELELDNMRVVLRWCARRGAPELGIRLLWAARRFWLVRGSINERRDWLVELLDAPGPPGPPVLRGHALLATGRWALLQGQLEQAASLLSAALALYEQADKPDHIATTLNQLGHVWRERGSLAAARACYERALALRGRLGDLREVGVALAGIGRTAQAGGDFAAARASLEAALAVARERGDRFHETHYVQFLGRLALDRGDPAAAARLFRESLEAVRELRGPALLARALEGLAGVAARQGQAQDALLLVGAAERVRDDADSPLMRSEKAMLDRWLSSALAAVDGGQRAALLERGRSLASDEAVRLSERIAAIVAGAPATPRARGADSATRFTRREREIAGLVAQGLSNRQIADELVVSQRTVEWHVANLLGKLGLQTRAQVAVWAAEHGLEPAD